MDNLETCLIVLFALVKLGHVYFFLFRPDAFTQSVYGMTLQDRNGRAEFQTFQSATYLSEVAFVLWAAFVNGTPGLATVFICFYLGLMVTLRVIFLLRYRTLGPTHRAALAIESVGLVTAVVCLLY